MVIGMCGGFTRGLQSYDSLIPFLSKKWIELPVEMANVKLVEINPKTDSQLYEKVCDCETFYGCSFFFY
jgi:hypothetical protein